MNTLYFILVCIFWGGSYLAIKTSLDGFSPFLAATLRLIPAIIFAFLYIRHKKIRYPEKRYIVQVILNGALGIGVSWVFLFWGEIHVEPAIASIIISTSPIFTAIFAVAILGKKVEPMTWNKWVGIFLGIIGITIIFFPFLSSGSFRSVQGLSAIVGTALCYGITVAWLKKLTPHVESVMLLFLECLGALIVLLPIAVIYGMTNYALTGGPLLIPCLAIGYMSIFSTTLAFVFFYKLVESLGSVTAAATTYLVPIISILLDWFLLGKWVGNQALFGALVVFAALRLVHKSTPPAIE